MTPRYVARLRAIALPDQDVLLRGRPNVEDFFFVVPVLETLGMLRGALLLIEERTDEEEALVRFFESQNAPVLSPHRVERDGKMLIAFGEDGRRHLLGPRQELLVAGVSVATLEERARAGERRGTAIFFVAQDDRTVGIVSLAWERNPDARSTALRIADLGIAPVVVTSLSELAATELARSLDAIHVRAGVEARNLAATLSQIRSTSGYAGVVLPAHRPETELAARDVDVAFHLGVPLLGGPTRPLGVQIGSARLRDVAYTAYAACSTLRVEQRTFFCFTLHVAVAVVVPFAVSTPALACALALVCERIAVSLPRENVERLSLRFPLPER